MTHKRLTIFCLVGAFCLQYFVLDIYAQKDSDVRMLFQLGQQAYEQGRYQDAVNYFERCVSLNNSFAGAYYALGLAYQQVADDPHYPLWYFQTAIQIDPNFTAAYDVLCRSYYQLQEYLQAEAVCVKALELNPDLLSSQLSLAWVYLIGRSDADQAIFYFEKVIQKIDTPFVHFGLGMAYAMRGESGRVLEIITRLRAQGMEEFAVHLEAFVRSRRSPEKFFPPGAIKDKASIPAEDAVEPAEPRQPDDPERAIVPVPVPVPIILAPTALTGSPQVQMKGTVISPQIGVKGSAYPVIEGGQKGRHPGGLSE